MKLGYVGIPSEQCEKIQYFLCWEDLIWLLLRAQETAVLGAKALACMQLEPVGTWLITKLHCHLW